MILRSTAGLFLSLIICLNVSGQTKKFGNISPYDFSNYPSKYDSTESAVVLFDVGYSYFTYPSYDCVLERHVRIKVINDEGLKEGDISLIFNRDVDQNIQRIKANVYTLENGKVIKKELDSDQIFEEKLYDNVSAKKFVVPALTKGDIFEYSYKKIVGNPFYLPDWEFHKDIPVQLSQYKMKIPNNFLYNTIIKGVDTVLVSNIEEYIDQTGRGNNITLSKLNIPPVKEIPFINSVDDFKTKILNQLVYVNFTGSPSRKFNNTWEKVAKEIRDHPSIGKQRLDGEMKDAIDVIIKGIDNPLEKTKIIYEFVADRIAWNGIHYLISDQGIRDAFKNEVGNSADINLMLHEMLEYAGIKSNMAFISTKSNGAIITNYPIIQQFNHIVIIVDLGEDNKFLLDATEGNRALNMPPLKDLYSYVFLVKEDSFSWLKSAPGVKTSKTILIDQKFNQDGNVEADVSGVFSGYFAERLRSEKEEDITDILNENFDFEIDSVDVKNFSNVDEGISFTINGTYENTEIKESQETIYISPFLIIDTSENPFKASERLFPIYFPFTFKYRIVANVEIPDAYKVDEIPTSNLYKIGENQARVRFVSQKNLNKVTMLIDFSINDIQFSEDIYDPIKELFNTFQKSQENKIVLKKITE